MIQSAHAPAEAVGSTLLWQRMLQWRRKQTYSLISQHPSLSSQGVTFALLLRNCDPGKEETLQVRQKEQKQLHCTLVDGMRFQHTFSAALHSAITSYFSARGTCAMAFVTVSTTVFKGSEPFGSAQLFTTLSVLSKAARSLSTNVI